MLVQKKHFNKSGGGFQVVTTCPVCGNSATFDRVSEIPDLSTSDNSFILGQRICPNPECRVHLFFIKDLKGGLKTFPSVRIDFNSTSIPDKIKKSFEEAIICHAENCFVASAIMIRRTLEELCEERGATGKNLKERIRALKSKVILPEALFNALDELRLLGNDAAHIESKTFEEVGVEEVEIGIELTKEILKACYQFKNLVDKLNKLKKEK